MQKVSEEIISAGIDIGTSTTKLILSQFSILNVAGISHVPRIEIVDKKVLHKSGVYRTPLIDENVIDLKAIETIIDSEYEAAGIEKESIETGAVIITGEAATKDNASEMVHHLSEEAGEFLVATAGPHLESVIAAKGSGVYQRSKGNQLVRANVDIGGGTANIAVFKNERLLGTCALHIGGRLIEFEAGKIRLITRPIQRLCQAHELNLQVGTDQSDEQIPILIDLLVEELFKTLNYGVEKSDLLLLVEGEPDWTEAIDVVTFSGGVAECIYQMEASSQALVYDDIGLMLARHLQSSPVFQKFKIEQPDETVRATVLGAGTQITEISGATIEIDSSELPLKNIPIIKHDFNQDFDSGLAQMPATFQQANKIFDTVKTEMNFALALSNIPYINFKRTQSLAEAILTEMNKRHHQSKPIILVVESDIAKVLGQSILALGAKQALICIDQIKVNTGDYIDIGRILKSEVVPVVVKTLTFHTSD